MRRKKKMNECEEDYHDDISQIEPINMKSGSIDGVYYVACLCHDCGKTVYEKYEYVGVVDKIE